MELQVKEFQPAKVVINYETLKEELIKQLDSYKGLVVTEETLGGCKDAQKELARLRNEIDTRRKEKKKELEKPIKDFEAQCKNLIALVEEVEKPIKEGIKVFDDQKREEKRQQAEELILDVAADYDLNEKYRAQLTVIDKYMNLTATKKAVREDLETRAFALSVEQAREKERLEILEHVLNSENARLNTKLQLSMFQRLIDSEAATNTIIEEIKLRAAMIYEAENKPAEQPKEPAETPVQQETPQATPEKQYTAVYEITGSVEELRSVSTYLRSKGISYRVTEQREA